MIDAGAENTFYLCARNALAASFDSSDDQVFMVMIFSFGTQFRYTCDRLSIAERPSGLCSPPMRIRSGRNRSDTADPSAKNSGFERTWNLASEKNGMKTVGTQFSQAQSMAFAASEPAQKLVSVARVLTILYIGSQYLRNTFGG